MTMGIRENDRTAGLQELRNLAELLESDDQMVDTLASIPLRDLPERLGSEGFSAELIIELLRNDLIDVINRYSSGKEISLSDMLDMSVSTLDQTYPDLSKGLIVAIETIAARSDDSLLSVAGGTSHSSDLKDQSPTTSTSHSDNNKKEVAEAIGATIVGVVILGGLGKLISIRRERQLRERQFEKDLDKVIKKAETTANRDNMFVEAYQNRAQNGSKSLRNDSWLKLKAWAEENDLEEVLIKDLSKLALTKKYKKLLGPDDLASIQRFRDNRIDKARGHWEQYYADITSNVNVNKVQFKESVRVREISQTIRQSLRYDGQVLTSLHTYRKDLPGRSLRPAPLEDLKSELYKQKFRAGEREQFLAKEFVNLNMDPSRFVKLCQPSWLTTYRPYLEPSDVRPAQLRGILKRPNIVPESNWDFLRTEAQNLDVGDINTRRLSHRVARLGIHLPKPNHSEPSDRLSQALRESNIGSLLENSPELQRDVIRHGSILSQDVSDDIEDAKQASGKALNNAEQDVKNAARIEVEEINSAIDDVPDIL